MREMGNECYKLKDFDSMSVWCGLDGNPEFIELNDTQDIDMLMCEPLEKIKFKNNEEFSMETSKLYGELYEDKIENVYKYLIDIGTSEILSKNITDKFYRDVMVRAAIRYGIRKKGNLSELCLSIYEKFFLDEFGQLPRWSPEQLRKWEKGE
jgi:hypothetical protein